MSSAEKKTYHHGDLRATLLEAAVDVIRERGVSGLSLRECARRAGVSHAAPYRHFAGKEALLMAVAGEGFRMLVTAGRESMVELTDPGERLDAYGVAYVQFAIDNPERHRLMFAAALDSTLATEEDLKSSVEAFELLETATGETLGPGEDVAGAAFAFWSLVHGMAMLILDGRIPLSENPTHAEIETLTRATFAHWRQSARG